MPVDQSHFVFQKLSRQLTRLAEKPAPERVHKFRTTGRRVETLLYELLPSPNRNAKKLLKGLARLRKKAGRVRDLDVQTNALRNLKIPEGAAQKTQLLRALAEERERGEKKLAAAFDKPAVRELRKRLKRTAKEIEIPQAGGLTLAMLLMVKLVQDTGPLTERALHQYRIIGKRARYLAELDSKDPAARLVVEQLGHLQDVIGDWHDWLKLTEKAEKLFGTVRESALVAALRNITRAKFRQAVDALSQARSVLSTRQPVPVENRRQPVRAAQTEAAVA